MKATLRYLAGTAGPSGFGSKSTAEQVTQNCSHFLPSNLTALITGKSQIISNTKVVLEIHEDDFPYIFHFYLHSIPRILYLLFEFS